MPSPSERATAKYRHMRDGDDARDLAFDYDADEDRHYQDYLDFCAEEGITPLPKDARASELADAAERRDEDNAWKAGCGE